MFIYIKIILLMSFLTSCRSIDNETESGKSTPQVKIQKEAVEETKPAAVYTYNGNTLDDEEEETDVSHEIEEKCRLVNNGTPKIIKKLQMTLDGKYTIEFNCIPKK